MRFIQEEEAKEALFRTARSCGERRIHRPIIRNGFKVAALVPTEETFLDSEEERELRRQTMERLLEARKGWGKTKKVSLEEILEWRYARE